jgi:DNA-binding PadR family transcriptional regulator
LWLNWAKHRHRGLRTWVLYILEKGPKNGAEIMDSMESMSQGWWRPSPGSVYPMLESMVEEKLIKKLDDNKYQITAQGREEIDWTSKARRGESGSLADIIGQISNNVSYLEDLSKSKSSDLGTQSKKISELASRLKALGED